MSRCNPAELTPGDLTFVPFGQIRTNNFQNLLSYRVQTLIPSDRFPIGEWWGVTSYVLLFNVDPYRQDYFLSVHLSLSKARQLPSSVMLCEKRMREKDDSVPTRGKPLINLPVEAVAQSDLELIVPYGKPEICEEFRERLS